VALRFRKHDWVRKCDCAMEKYVFSSNSLLNIYFDEAFFSTGCGFKVIDVVQVFNVVTVHLNEKD
jgi:hypothetical protein